MRGWISSVPEIEPPTMEEMKSDESARRALQLKERNDLLAYLAERAENHEEPEKRIFFRRAHRFYTLSFRNLWRPSTIARLNPRWIKDWKAGTGEIPAASYKVKREAITFQLHPESLKAIREQLKEDGRLDSGSDAKPLRLDEARVR